MTLADVLHKTLSNSGLFEVGGTFSKNLVIEKAIQYNEELLSLLYSDESIRRAFFIEKNNITIFKSRDFNNYLLSKEFLPDSYTRFSNRIGLMSNDKFLLNQGNVQLAWPYKDCTLIGGAEDPEDSNGYNELMLNNVLSNDEVTRLNDPKVFCNAIRYSPSEEKGVSEIDHEIDNFLIRGNNYVALQCLKVNYSRKIKLIYIDPPYNTKNDSFRYNDKFSHSTWLTFMKNRLEASKVLLREDGVIFVQCDDNEQAYLRVLLDEIFGRGNFLNTISVKMKNISGASGGGEDKRLKKNIEYIHVYSKNRSDFSKFYPVYDRLDLMTVINSTKNWKYTRVITNYGNKKYVKTIKDGAGEEIRIYEHNGHEFKNIKELMASEGLAMEACYLKYFNDVFRDTNAQTSIRKRVEKSTTDLSDFISIEYTPRSGKDKGKLKTVYYKGKKRDQIAWLDDICIKENSKLIQLKKLGTLWDVVGETKNVAKEGDVQLKDGKKPERLIEKIIQLSTDEGDLVLDYHLGSGTTAAVCHKMKRRYIGIEQLDYGDDDSVLRLQNVIAGDETGISLDHNWKGGGSFVYLELAKLNQIFIDRLQEIKDENEVSSLVSDIIANSRLSFNIGELKHFESDEFRALTFEDKKKTLLGCLDKNHLYVPLSECEDIDHGLNEYTLSVNKMFYGD